MARTRKRSSTSVIVPSTALEQATTTLQDLPEKPRETYSLREAIALLQEPISLALSRGYSYDEVRAILSENGIDIAPSSLRRYLSLTKPKRATSAPKATRGRRARGKAEFMEDDGEDQSSVDVEALAVDEGEQAASEVERKGKTPSRRRSKVESGEEGSEAKVAAKAKPKPATRAKSSARSTSTRRRRTSKNS
jgi:hypothetical protein